MAYTIEGNPNLLDTLVLDKNTSSLKIDVRNNESIKFDLSAFKDEYIKIVLNFGDETEEEYILKPLYSSTGAISIDTINWATTEHYFAFKNEDDFIENKEMQINIYSIDEEKYKWTYPYTEFWLLNTFKTEGNTNYVGSINCTSGNFEYQANLKVYAGIRPCFYASTKLIKFRRNYILNRYNVT